MFSVRSVRDKKLFSVYIQCFPWSNIFFAPLLLRVLLVLSVLCVCVLIEVIVIVIVIVLSIRLRLKVLHEQIDLVDHIAAHTDFDHSLRVIALGVGSSGELIGDLEVETFGSLTALSGVKALALFTDTGKVSV